MASVTKIMTGAVVFHAVEISSERIRPRDVVKLIES